MREQKKFEKLVRDRLDPVSDDIIKKLESEFPQYAEEKPQKPKCERTFKRKAWVSALCGAAAAAVILCAIIIPVSVRNAGGDKPKENNRNSYITVSSEINIKEYNATHGTNLLYFDWYDTDISYKTELYKDKITQDVYGISETYIGNGGDSVLLDCVFDDSMVGIIENNKKHCDDEQSVNGCTVYFGESTYSVAVFEYENIEYCLRLDDVNSLYLTELVAELLS